MRNKNKEKEVKYFLLGAGLTLLVMAVYPVSAQFVGGTFVGDSPTLTQPPPVGAPSIVGPSTLPQPPAAGTLPTSGVGPMIPGLLQQAGLEGPMRLPTEGMTDQTLQPIKRPAGGETQFPGRGATEGQFPGKGKGVSQGFPGRGQGVTKTREDLGPPPEGERVENLLPAEEASSTQRARGKFQQGKKGSREVMDEPPPLGDESSLREMKGKISGKHGGKGSFGEVSEPTESPAAPSEGSRQKTPNYYDFGKSEDSRFIAPKRIKAKDIVELDLEEVDHTATIRELKKSVAKVMKLKSKDKIQVNFVTIAKIAEDTCEEAGLDCEDALNFAAAALDSAKAKAKDYKKALRTLVDEVTRLYEAAVEEAEFEEPEL